MRQFGRPDPSLLFTILVLLAGCQDSQEPIVAYQVQKHEAIQIPIDTEATQPVQDATHRLLAAIVLDENVAWYFKSITPLEKMPPNAVSEVEKLLQGLRLEHASKPTWTLGEAWRELPGAGMRVANLMLGDAEFAVSKLPIRSNADRKQYLLDNINRWRRQVQLLPISLAQLDKYSSQLATADGHEATLVDFNGKLNASAMPSMGGSSPPMAGSSNRPASKPLQYTVPEHWQEQQAGMMQLALFEATDGGTSAQISISQLGGAAGGVLANVNRWRDQVGLAPLEDEKQVEPQPLKVAGNDAVLLEFRGDKGKSIAVAMVPNGGSIWFFKMMGDTAVVDQESDSFRQFLATVRWN